MSTAPVLALIGDRYHNPDFIRLNFNRLFGELGISYEYTGNYEWFDTEEATDAQLSGRSLLIVARDGLTFIPSIFGRPHLLVVHTPGGRPVIQYPAATVPALTSPATLDALQQRLHALDHPVRLRIARSLIGGARTTTELADTWQLTKPEISRHLTILRDAGLITPNRDGRYVRHQLDIAALARIGGDTIDALLR